MNKIKYLFKSITEERYLQLEEIARSVGRYSVNPKRVSEIEMDNKRTDKWLERRFINL